MSATPGKDRKGSLAPFVHLRVHSAYSLLEGALHLGTIARLWP